MTPEQLLRGAVGYATRKGAGERAQLALNCRPGSVRESRMLVHGPRSVAKLMAAGLATPHVADEIRNSIYGNGKYGAGFVGIARQQ